VRHPYYKLVCLSNSLLVGALVHLIRTGNV